MKLAVSGKGGSGKTTISGTLARLLARQGHQVLAIDGDPNPNLAIALGIGGDRGRDLAALPRDLMVDQVDEEGVKTRVLSESAGTITARYGVVAPDNVTLLVGTKVDHAGAG
jgi:CO dehydrogenase maturation factor